ncbi:hypothetical protein OIDMADRAFT_48892 [Oidiodendron maius Zn]|uniref:Uncharacterized protein n=1 Tax=Oidiodendron maius (strain Zn) TaxID=913774 RepID=A0A0C3I3U7_OIDMZ|nr:hypothetical protein OIDMADRAFT_48892 [Oidiodendron maius Zn]
MAIDANMDPAVLLHHVYHRIHPLLNNLGAGMIGMNTGMVKAYPSFVSCPLTIYSGNSSAAESLFCGIKESGYAIETGDDVAIEEHLIAKTGFDCVRSFQAPRCSH